MEAAPFSIIKIDPCYESNVSPLIYEPPLLRISVNASSDESFQIDFDEQIWAFRYMEEGDLSYYWQAGVFDDRFLIYQVKSGGWLSKEGSTLDILGIARSQDNWLKEWFIPTRNFSVTVLSNSIPKIARLRGA